MKIRNWIGERVLFLQYTGISFFKYLYSLLSTVDILLDEPEELPEFGVINEDTLQRDDGTGPIYLSICDEAEPSSCCLTPVSLGVDDQDLSMVVNKGSMTLSVDVSEQDPASQTNYKFIHFSVIDKISIPSYIPFQRIILLQRA